MLELTKFAYSAIALAMASLNTHLLYSRNGAILDGTFSSYASLLAITGLWATLPLLITASQAPFKPSSAANWPVLVLVAVGFWLDVEVGASHVALLLDPCLVGASWYLASKYLQGRLHWGALPLVLTFFSIAPLIANSFGSYSRG